MKAKLIMCIAFLTFGMAAQADIFAGGPLYGSHGQTHAVCYLFNAGTAPVKVTTNEIFRLGTVGSLPLNFDSCNVVAPGAGCVISAPILDASSHACRLVVWRT
jgi:hypothetical protein